MENQWLLEKAMSFIWSSLWYLFHLYGIIMISDYYRETPKEIFDVCCEVHHKKINLFCFVRYLFSRVIEYIVNDILCLCAFVSYWQNQGKKDQSTNEMRFVFIWLLFNYWCKQHHSIWYQDMNLSRKNISLQNNGLKFSSVVHFNISNMTWFKNYCKRLQIFRIYNMSFSEIWACLEMDS